MAHVLLRILELEPLETSSTASTTGSGAFNPFYGTERAAGRFRLFGWRNGNRCEWGGRAWRYGAGASAARPCPKCRSLPTPEGHDACLGRLPGVGSACCGRGGACQAYVCLWDGTRVKVAGPEEARSVAGSAGTPAAAAPDATAI